MACVDLYLPDPDATDRLARLMAQHLRTGDTVLLSGPVGSGKSHFARAFIRCHFGPSQEVPSPSFTLVQTYQNDAVEIWHADLYRLTHPDEAQELGLADAMADAICLIEWPDRLGEMQPLRPIHLDLTSHGDGRIAKITAPHHPDLQAALRAQSLDDFLDGADWGSAARQALAGDASGRRYLRLTRGTKSAVLMDAPDGQPDDPAQFLRIADHLAGLGLSPPQCYAQDLAQGFLLLEDLGDGLLARLIKANPSREGPLLQAAVDVLIHLQSHAAPLNLPDLTADEWAQSAMLGIIGDAFPLQSALAAALRTHADGPRVLILRDYHGENLLFLPERRGLAQIGLLDFQTAQMGQPAYDLVSLLQDARREVSPVVESDLCQHFIQKTGQSETAFCAQYATLGALRALRILGIFARLNRNGKPQYLALMPRVYAHLLRNLQHPVLADLRALCAQFVPAPIWEKS
jgi:tRNA threonylcarbamoyl adenosine modification protein YjeE